MSSSGGGEKVIELSVDETNKLRAQLGLAPLRTEGSNGGPTAAATNNEASQQQNDKNDNEEVLEMSVNESNALRENLGLPPLRGGSTKQQQEQHAPAVNEGDVKATTARVEKAKLQRQVKEGATQYGKNSLGDEKTSALSFAEEMRKRRKAAKKAKKEQKKASAVAAAGQDEATPAYGESDVKGLTVGHTVGDFQEGSTTVLTLADTEILTADEASKRATGLNDDEARLENVILSEQQTIQEGLKEKRKMEMGMGRAGGYAGYDDDEFEELGGAQGPSRAARGAALTTGQDSKSKRKTRGFQIGAMLDQQDEEAESDIFAAHSGKAISLQPSQTDRTMSDFMTAEEKEELRPKKEKKKKDKEFKKKKKKKDKKENKRKVESDDEEEESTPIVLPSKKKSLADELEETAPVPAANRKRRRQAGENGDDDDDDDGGPSVIGSAGAKRGAIDKRAKYDAVMEKGNERTKAAFSKPKKPPISAHHADEEPDDAFLHAALAKARRLNRLKQLSGKSARGADAVAQSLEQSSQQQQAMKPESATSSGGGISFSIDDTREFTLALRVKKEQEKQQRDNRAKRETKGVVIKKEADAVKSESDDADNKPEPMTVDDAEEEEDVDMTELAKEVKEDKADVSDILSGGGTANVGRGLGNFMQMLRQTGEISGKKTRREEQRGRARDERTEEDYAPLDLSSVVRIDERNANERDREFASREVKLEYRDEHGRLLTRKEAFRDMSQQFHGFSSGKRKSEKKMKQIAREQAEKRIASRQGTAEGGMLGALKTTQKATGKAFVVHKM